MKHKLIIWTLSILFVGLLPACSDYLELEPKDGVTRGKFWNNKEEVKDAVMGCYASMMQYGNMERYLCWGELRADLVSAFNVKVPGSMYKNVQNGDISSSMNFCSWGPIYTVINNCNTVLHFAKDTKAVDESFSDELLAEYEAEAKCIRALMYFYLVRTFKDVPFITTPSLNDNQDYRVTQTAGDEIIDYLIEELKSIDRSENGTLKGIPFTYDKREENKGRFTVWSLKALLADLYLWKGDYENCIKQTSQVINSGQFTLVPVRSTPVEVEDVIGNVYTVYYPSEGDVDNLFLNMYVNGNSIESIFELQFGDDYENPFWSYFNPTSGVLGVNTETISPQGLFLPSNLDRGWFDIRGEGVDYKQGLIWKWIGLSRTTYIYRNNGESFSNWIFYRLADVMLMEAEALNQLGKETNDQEKLKASLALVKQIRSRACAPESTEMISDEEIIDAETLERYILEERARELAHEGKRWFDVLRNAKRNNYAGKHYLTEMALYVASPDKVYSLQTKWEDANSHYLPVNESELRTNPNLKQNPFYDTTKK